MAAVDTSPDRHPNPWKYVRTPFGFVRRPARSTTTTVGPIIMKRTPLHERIQSRPPEPMKPTQWALAGAFIGILFAVGSIARGDVAPGIVGGVLAGVLMYLVLRQISVRQWQRIRKWESRHGGKPAP